MRFSQYINEETIPQEAMEVLKKLADEKDYGDRLLKNFDWKFLKRNDHWKENRYEFEYWPKGGRFIKEPLIPGSSIIKERIKFPDILDKIEAQSKEHLVYRGMSYPEWEVSKRRGYIQSEGKWNFDIEKGYTLFGRQIDTAISYAGGFAPFHLAATYEQPGVIIGVSKEHMEDLPVSGKTDYVGLKKKLPIKDIEVAYALYPEKATKGWLDIVVDNQTGKVREGSAKHWSGYYTLTKLKD